MAYPVLTAEEHVLLLELERALADDDAYWADGGGCDTGGETPDTNRRLREAIRRFRRGKVVDRRPLEQLPKRPSSSLMNRGFGKIAGEVAASAAPATLVTRNGNPVLVLMSCDRYAAFAGPAGCTAPETTDNEPAPPAGG